MVYTLPKESGMQKIIPHLWFDTQAVEAAQFYTEAFSGSTILNRVTISDTPSGVVEIVNLSLSGYQFQFLSAGPAFTINSSLSFLVAAATKDEVDDLYRALSVGGQEVMPLGEYHFSPRYVWLKDKYGVSWQLMYRPGPAPTQKIVPAQMFTAAQAGRATEALTFYTGLFGGRVDLVSHYGPGSEPNAPEMVNHASFSLAGEQFALMDSALGLEGFTEAVSYIVLCDSQEEMDHYWEALSADPDAEACGWLKDQFGFSWQIVPRELDELMLGPATPQVTEALLKMKKLDLAELRRAAKMGSTS